MPEEAPAGTVVDVHAHVVVDRLFGGPDAPDPAVAELRWVDGRRRVFTGGRDLSSVVGEFVDTARMVAEAAAAGVDRLVLSPWVQLLPLGLGPADARRRCEVQNEALAGMVAADPGHLDAVGAVPLEHPVEAAAAVRAARAGGLVGVEVLASAAGHLGEPSLEPFWAAAEEEKALVFVHPAARGAALAALDDFYLWNTVGNPLETAVAAAHLALAGVLEHHPGLCVVLAHGGGALPALVGRLYRGERAVPGARGRLSEPLEASLARYHYDSVTHDPLLLRRLVEDVGPDHVLLGSDRPFDMGDPDPVGTVQAAGLGPVAEAAVLGGNAARLLERAGLGAPSPGDPATRR